MLTKPVRVAIYLRVSKDDGSQETDNQLLQLRAFCERWEGYGLVAEYVDRESGTRGRRERKDFDRMFADAARRRFDVLLDNSVGILLTYGTARILLAGDAEAKSEEYMASGPYTGPLTVVNVQKLHIP